jgi:hypothetical protein
LPEEHLIARGYAEYICLFERLFPAIGPPHRAGRRHNLRMCEAKSMSLDSECLTPVLVAYRMREFARNLVNHRQGYRTVNKALPDIGLKSRSAYCAARRAGPGRTMPRHATDAA